MIQTEHVVDILPMFCVWWSNHWGIWTLKTGDSYCVTRLTIVLLSNKNTLLDQKKSHHLYLGLLHLVR